LFVCLLLCWYFYHPVDYIPLSVEQDIQKLDVLYGVDHDEIADVKCKLIVKMAGAAKLRFGLMPQTQSNIVVVRRFMVAWAKDYAARDYDVLRSISRALALFFLPTQDDVFLHQSQYSKLTIGRNNMLRSYGSRIMSLFGPAKGP